MLTGIKYICFNKFLINKNIVIKKKPSKILICVNKFTEKKMKILLNCLLSLKLNIKIKVIVYSNLNSKLKNYQKINIEIITDLININSKLDWADILLCGQGLIMYEATLKRYHAFAFKILTSPKVLLRETL